MPAVIGAGETSSSRWWPWHRAGRDAGGPTGPLLALGLLLTVFLSLGWTYSSTTPLFEAPDELLHYLLVRQLAAGGGLPVLKAGMAADYGAAQEGGQAPLYYLLGAAMTRWAFPPGEAYWPRNNPHGGPGIADAPGTKNLWLHGPDEDFPYQGPFLPARLLRALSLLLGMLAVVATFLTAREIWPGRPSLAIGAAAVNAFNPQFLFISGAISNDPMAAAAGNWVAYLSVRLLRRGPGRAAYLALGFAIGIAMLSKASLVSVVGLSVLAALWLALRGRLGIRGLAERVLLLSLPPALIAGWWYLRNILLYGDPFALTASALFAGGARGVVTAAEIVADLDGLRRSFWAVFGAFNIVVDPAVYWLYDALLALAAIGLGLYLARLWRDRGDGEARFRLLALLFLLACAVLAFAGLVRWRLLVLAFQGRLLFPVVGAISLLVAAGVIGPLPRRLGGWLAGALGLVLLGLAMAMPVLYIAPAYARAPVLDPTRVAQLPATMPVRFGNDLELVSYEVPPRLEPGRSAVPVTMYWRATSPLAVDYSIFIHLTAPNGLRLGQMDTYPGLGMSPTRQWRAGEVVAGHYAVPLDAVAAADQTMLLTVGAYVVGAGPRLEVQSSGWVLPDRQAVLGKVYGPRAGQAGPAAGEFGGRIALLDGSLGTIAVRPGEHLEGAIAWQALQPIDRDYTAFVHLVGPAGLVAQYDSPPLGGQYPTTRWDAGEVVRDRFAMDLPGNLAPGEYRLVTGFYDPQSRERLPAGSETALQIARVIVSPRL